MHKFIISINYSLCSLPKINVLINQCYTNPSIPIRVESLKQFPINFNQIFSIKSYNIKIPQFLNLTTSKNLQNFHVTNKTPTNLQILHSLAHIEFNAFLAYADTLFRFGHSQEYKYLWENSNAIQITKFRKEIKKVAFEQGSHCISLINRLKQLGIDFGNFPVISNLTNTIYLTDKDVMMRLAIISIVHEGRGIKSIKKLIDKLQSKDKQSMSILKMIQIEEYSHFQIGLKWFKYFCQLKYNKIQQQPKLSYRQFLETQLQRINNQFHTKISLADIREQNQPNSPTTNTPTK